MFSTSLLIPVEVENTRKNANVRIHVERVIGLVLRKFRIFEGIIPIGIYKVKNWGSNSNHWQNCEGCLLPNKPVFLSSTVWIKCWSRLLKLWLKLKNCRIILSSNCCCCITSSNQLLIYWIVIYCLIFLKPQTLNLVLFIKCWRLEHDKQ